MAAAEASAPSVAAEGTTASGGVIEIGRPRVAVDDIDSLCVVCYERKRTHALIPCGHMCETIGLSAP